MTIQDWSALAIAVFLVIGAIFNLVAGIGMLKLKDPMARLHAPTKTGTLGIGAFLLASMLHAYVFGEGSFHELLIMAFVFMTSPVSANFIARVHIHQRASALPLPPPEQDQTWSTLDVPPEDREIKEATKSA